MERSDGAALVNLAKKAIEDYVLNGHVLANPSQESTALNQKGGVFVTITENRMLRGCIGYPLPVLPVAEATIKAAIAAAVDDPRFPKLEKDELGDISVEVTVLSVPEQVSIRNEDDAGKKIIIGKEGLIIEKEPYEGLLLPQVATEERFNQVEFLEATCLKAGLAKDAWKDKRTKIYKFSGEVFR